MLRDYIYQNDNLVALKLHGTQAGVYYVISDHLGTPQQIVDATGTVVWKAAFLPFGKAQVLTETITNNIRFPGQYFDTETGLHYNWNRYYDPDTGRYLTPDPIGLAGGLNLFAYVQNDPVNWIDPFGLSRWYPVPGKKRWEVRRDQPHHAKDYRHDHYRHKGKEVPRKVDPETGEQKEHGKGKCTGDDEDVPQDVIDAANQAFSVTGNVGFDLGLLEGMEAVNDALDGLNDALPPPPIIPIPGFSGVPIGVPAIP
ncbi:RHS repeat-associated core domain-containing protein [Candidatus Electrothrix marina]|uniref:RHS repeat-associated core domain-containing protein n=1 Tax=Candidatus Electrothrix marina TaxID=1859130 RepID=A0A3S3R511_9BACT|nr:RHS repeat-associated core domain-containing protein [Candidatus Electrothrix marina]RWX52024.1 RHS repeat-associated core domain-containing protein [Candidatus Electrothrix marina]